MPVKSYTDSTGKKKYYASFYYTSHTGERRRKKKEGFATAGAAKKYESDFLEQHSGTCDILFKNLVENYIDDCRQRLKVTTLRHKEFYLKKYILPFFSAFAVSEITPLQVRQWQNEILKKGYKATFQRTIHVQLSAVFNFAVKYYGLKRNPANVAGSIGALKPTEKMQFYTLEQFRQFLPCVAEKYKLAFKILFFCGLRVGEMLALQIKDFDLNAGTLNVNKTLDVKTLKSQPPKTVKSNRIVTLPPFLATEIQDYITTKFFEPQPEERLFFWLLYITLSKENIRAANEANLPHIRVHDFRHSHASLLINLDFSPLVISERLGHESVKTTLEIYSHLYPAKAEQVVQKLDKFRM